MKATQSYGDYLAATIATYFSVTNSVGTGGDSMLTGQQSLLPKLVEALFHILLLLSFFIEFTKQNPSIIEIKITSTSISCKDS